MKTSPWHDFLTTEPAFSEPQDVTGKLLLDQNDQHRQFYKPKWHTTLL